MDALLAPWVAAVGDDPGLRAAGADLLARYAEPHRGYHDRTHLAELLRALRSLADDRVPAPVVVAAYAHDAVYDAAPGDEQRSADLAARLLRGRLPDDDVAEVVRLVLLTAGHDPAPDDDAGTLLCDADLAVLASPPGRYRVYVAGVRREHAHLDDPAFRTGRAAVLQGLAARPWLFSRAEARRRWEAPARRNLADELAALAAPPP